jgi:hypothetical protein
MAEDHDTTRRLLDGLRELSDAAPSFDPPQAIEIPSPGDLELETVMLPRDAFFGSIRAVPVKDAPDFDTIRVFAGPAGMTRVGRCVATRARAVVDDCDVRCRVRRGRT